MEDKLNKFDKWKTTSNSLEGKLIFCKQPNCNPTRLYKEDNLNIFENGRWPQYFWKWKTTSIFLKMEDNLNIFENGRRPQYFFLNGRQPKFFIKYKTTSIFWKWKTTLIFYWWRWPQFLWKCKTTSNNKNMFLKMEDDQIFLKRRTY